MQIAVGNSRKDKRWKNKEITWEEFATKCSNTIRTTETVSEYKKMSKARQDDIKDVGGYVLGTLKEGRRKKGFVILRSAITLDIDHAIPDIWDAITMMFDYKCLMYSTHKSTPEAPRVRLIIPLCRTVTEDEYPAVSRMIAKDIGIEMIDDTCHEPARLMYWPSSSSDGEFLYEEQDAPMLDPDKVLSRYADWHDTSLWPVSSRQSEVTRRTIAKQADPLEKPGIVGAFCRTYDIQAALDTFLPDVYKPSHMAGRYDYTPADSTAGVVIYEDKWCYSFHATDPASGQLMNAFDVVRVHKFGDLDDKAAPDTQPQKFPSYKAMCDFAIKDPEVRLCLAKERSEKASDEFGDDNENWQLGLELDKTGAVKASLSNFVTILRCDPKLNKICYNEHRCGVDIREMENLPWKPLKLSWSDADMATLASYLDKTYGIFSLSMLKQAFLTVTAERSFHPIKEFFDSLPSWDGIERVDRLLPEYLGAEDTPYINAVMRKALIAAVSRIYEPGKKFDYILVVSGPQGIGKSTFFSRLGGKYFSDSLSISDMRDKTGAEKLQGYWILELSELDGIKKMDVETVKSFISRTDDKYRQSYGTVVESHPRQCIIVGTTNNIGFLRDITGNRRFWPVEVSGKSEKKPWDLDDDTVKQIWAETLLRYDEGEELILSGDAAGEAIERQKDALERDDREGLVREFLDKKLPSNWKDMDLSARRFYLTDDSFGTTKEGSELRTLVCTLELWAECLGKDPGSMKKADAYELNAILSKIEGWKKYDGNKSGRVRFQIYGPQNAYMRCV